MNLSNSISNSLSIRLNSDGFSLYIYDENKLLISSKTVEIELTKQTIEDLLIIFNNSIELKLNYKSVQLIYESDYYSLIPYKLFEKENIRDFLNFQHPESQKFEYIADNYLIAFDIYIAFAVPNNLYQAINQFFPQVSIESHIYAFINEKMLLQKQDSVFVIDRTQQIDIIAIEKGAIQLVNTYKCASPETALYFILKVYEQLKLDVNQCITVLSSIKSNPALEELIKKYIQQYKIYN